MCQNSFDPPPAEEPKVAVFVPALVFFLLKVEREKGAPLDEVEVLELTSRAPCIQMDRSDALVFEERRGFSDIDPDNAWEEWQMARKSLMESD